MIPKVYTASFQAIEKYCKDDTIRFLYELCIFFMNCEFFYFPHITHTKFNAAKNPTKQFLYKNIKKMFEKYKDKISSQEFVGFIKAQFEIFKLNEQHSPLIGPHILHSKASEYRYIIWLRLVAEKQIMEKDNKVEVTNKYIDCSMKLTKFNIDKIFGPTLTFEDYKKNIRKILLMVKAHQLCIFYCYCSRWIKKLPQEILEEIQKYHNFGALEKCDYIKIQNSYDKFFEYEKN